MSSSLDHALMFGRLDVLNAFSTSVFSAYYALIHCELMKIFGGKLPLSFRGRITTITHFCMNFFESFTFHSKTNS